MEKGLLRTGGLSYMRRSWWDFFGGYTASSCKSPEVLTWKCQSTLRWATLGVSRCQEAEGDLKNQGERRQRNRRIQMPKDEKHRVFWERSWTVKLFLYSNVPTRSGLRQTWEWDVHNYFTPWGCPQSCKIFEHIWSWAADHARRERDIYIYICSQFPYIYR